MRQINILLTLDIHGRIENFPTVVKIGPINSYRKRLSEIPDASLYTHSREESPACFSTPVRPADMCIRAGIDTYPTRDLARFNEGVCRGAHLHTKPRTGESRRIYAISGHGLRRQSVPWHSRGSLNLGDHVGEALCANISSLPSSFLRPHPTFSLSLPLS